MGVFLSPQEISQIEIKDAYIMPAHGWQNVRLKALFGGMFVSVVYVCTSLHRITKNIYINNSHDNYENGVARKVSCKDTHTQKAAQQRKKTRKTRTIKMLSSIKNEDKNAKHRRRSKLNGTNESRRKSIDNMVLMSWYSVRAEEELSSECSLFRMGNLTRLVMMNIWTER